MKKFFAEFKKFITRGNVLDMAVGVIVGGAFTAIVNALSNNILKPIINWLLAQILGSNSLNEMYTYLLKVYTTDAEGAEIVDLAQSIYIDWGAFINAIINFILIAFVLFCIVKVINKVAEGNKELQEKAAKRKPTKEEKKAMKAAGLNYRNKDILAQYRADQAAIKAAEEEAAKKEAEEKAAAERAANPTTEDLLKMILAQMQK